MALRIAFVWRGSVEALPPAMSLAKHLAGLGCDVCWIAGTAAAECVGTLAVEGVRCIPLGISSTGLEPPLEKVGKALNFRKRAWQEIEKLAPSTKLWVLNTETAIVLGRRLLNRSYVLQLYELHENRLKKRLVHSYVRGAVGVVCPEPNRALIIRAWHGLSSNPIVIPNVPFAHDTSPCQDLGATVAGLAIESPVRRNQRIALYQGHVQDDRDLSVYCRVFARRSGEWRFILMGRDVDCVSRYRTLCPDLIHVPHLNAPRHLEVTSWADLGVVGYNHESLNNLYCAPNKIYEYGSFGIPILANDVPGLTGTVGRYSAGVCAKSDEDQVQRGLDHIERRYEYFSAGSRRLYDDALRVALPEGANQVLNRLN